MVVRDELIRRRVLFIGTSVPMETSEGLDAVQQPLRDRYPIDESKQIEGILAYLTVSQSGLQMEYCDASKDVILFPISSVTLCAAVRCISVINNATKERVAKFVSLSSVTAGGANAKRPAIFTAITRRTVGKKVLECHGFVCESDRDALDLVQATSTADKMSKGRVMNGSFTLTHANDTLKSGMNGHSEHYNMRLKSGEVRNAAPEFYDTPPQQGYFYTSKSNIPVKKYTMEKVVSDGESERIRATSPIPLSVRPSVERRSAYSFQTTRTGPPPPVLHTLPRPAPNMVPVRTVPVQTHARPRFFSPPPTLLRQKRFPNEPYVVVGHPPPHPVVIDGPPHLIRGRPRRRGSESSASHSHEHASSRSSSPHETAYPRRTMNGDGDASSEVSSRPRTPPTDYDKGRSKARVSRREQYEMRHTNFYPSALRNGDVYPPGAPYDFYPPPPGRLVYVERARSVPPPVERARTLEKKNKKKNKKDKKNKRRTNGAPSDISTDSFGYMSEQGTSSNRPRDFRRFENQFKHERAFSRSLMEQNKQTGAADNQSYALNELMASRGRNGEPEPFAMY
ncbi:hypothetical protein LOTGIDRAFT_236174 [Lottia gigantea]|uniref:PID domain-containing protein n=1 Tax=Lottia gigantea TaxID=225164 RepID=V3Z268_LOTGI|nr:hypothetical protein LOTGIDRAFT_236174 [Lottia gigantea]ESO84668.1 hypothetical protein LOTGIDRAFT_236174 [Lottia gigantea]